MHHINTTIIGFSLLISALLSPGAMAQQQLLTTPSGGEVQQRVPCHDPLGRPVKCPWEKIKNPTLPSNSSEAEAEKKKNPCNPKGGQSVDTKACRDYTLGNPKPPINPK
ncbi:MAG: hypothetical protein KME08_18970 [Aphanothece sp. CMT-3BRIN-NPC111]|jgi:hypothetical protein|nr:hypothetical protein [Aphanothece sp. CMT-3BRIN-NPC111]